MKTYKTYLCLIVIILLFTIPIYGTTELPISGAENLLKYGFIKGYNGDLMLDKTITRAEVAVLLAEMMGVKQEAMFYAVPPGFKDVMSDKWYAPYISYGNDKGYLGGYPDGSFKPDNPVTAKEFAAFLMNALGYSGDYAYQNVISFAENHNVNISSNASIFLRRNAFESMWQAVNQPTKDSEIPLGILLGKIENSVNTPVDDVLYNENTVSTKYFIVEVNSSWTFKINFKDSARNTDKYKFKVTKDETQISFTPSWNHNNTAVTLSRGSKLIDGVYKISISYDNYGTIENYEDINIVVDPEVIATAYFETSFLTIIDEHTAEIGYELYNQYGEDITSTTLGSGIKVLSSTDHEAAQVNYYNKKIVVTHGSDESPQNLISDLALIELTLVEQSSGFFYKKDLSTFTNLGIKDVIIKGIVDQNGNAVAFVYDPNRIYYLDVDILDTNSQPLKSISVLSSLKNGLDAFEISTSNEEYVTVTKTADPSAPTNIAFRINIETEPKDSIPIVFILKVSTAQNSKITTYSTHLTISI